MYEAKQMTTAQAVGAASQLVDSPPPCESAASQYRVGLIRFEQAAFSFSWGRFWVLEPDEGKPSSPVLRGLGASNGARPLNNRSSPAVILSRRTKLRQPKVGVTDSLGYCYEAVARFAKWSIREVKQDR